MRVRSTVICDLPVSTVFSTLSRKRQDLLGKKVPEHKLCVLIFSTILD